ncbi:branched-chain amino acid ABC transporter substrate-binding protein [Shimazuella kribbensis]|uniref:branched-chain amino acid ABC transporter substrate-binding protein n=1 Tax=Shimazuella kribbensis TaxID=139808 RepID=UPI00040E4289|nr:branched-chain amino acid ABC transporter substrate-binding protein [Shimazuella kribbensis]
MKKVFALGLSLSLLSISIIGCSNNSSGNVIKIATQTPLSGNQATVGEAIKNGAQLAIDDHAEAFKKLGFDLKLAPYDDQADPKKGVANAQQIGADQSILGVVGHYNSGVAIPSASTYQKNKLVMVSPANTAVELTESGNKSVHRIVARDDVQGSADANYATKKLNAKSIFIITDKTAYGEGIASNFQKQAEQNGAKITGHEGITPGEKDFNGVLNRVSSAKPDFIFFGGIYSEFGILVKQAREKGIMAPMMGGDGVDSSDMYKIAGDAIKDVYYSTTAADVSKSEEGKKWAERYKAKFNKDPQSYAFYGYDAMNVLLKGLEDAIKKNGSKKPTREQVLDAVHLIKDYQGIASKVSFDDKGDNDFAKVFIHKFENNQYPGPLVGEEGKQ